MAPSLLSLLFTLTLLQPPLSTANLHKTTAFRSHSASTAAAPTTYFEVTRPIPLPKTKPCSHRVLRHQFAYTYGKPPIVAAYTPPPPNCRRFERAVLEWTASSRGRQFDRIFGVWLGGAEILRSCTAEPTPAGIVWTVKKDVTKYRSLLTEKHNVSVYIGNIVDSTYTGVYHVNLTFHFYPYVEINDLAADLILPISRTPPLSGGLWFEIENSTAVEGTEVEIPRNVYKAVLEVYVSFHENDESWYGNFPNDYISLNNLTAAGNGPFREVLVRLDGGVVGAVWPFTVIYTGGVNPYFWRPISGIGSFDLPTYDVEITPFLGKLLDGKPHFFEFSVTNALNIWYVDANLHLWLDKNWEKTSGKVLEHKTSPISSSSKSSISGSDGSFSVKFSRSIVSRGSVRSSHGTITTKSSQELRYSNKMELRNGGNFQKLNQIIKLREKVTARNASSAVLSTDSRSRFGVYLYSDGVDDVKGTESYKSKVKLDLEEKRRENSELGARVHKLKNLQSADGFLVVEGKTKTIHGLGSTKQDYRYTSDDSCFYRSLRSSNYTVLHDKESRKCKQT